MYCKIRLETIDDRKASYIGDEKTFKKDLKLLGIKYKSISIETFGKWSKK